MFSQVGRIGIKGYFVLVLVAYQPLSITALHIYAIFS